MNCCKQVGNGWLRKAKNRFRDVMLFLSADYSFFYDFILHIFYLSHSDKLF